MRGLCPFIFHVSLYIILHFMYSQKNYIKEETIERMRLDEEVLIDLFREYISVSVCSLTSDMISQNNVFTGN